MINLIAPINQLGYGITGLNVVKALSKKTLVALWPMHQPQVTTGEDAELISNCIQRTQFPDFDAPCIRIWHQHDMSQFVGKGKHIGYPIFELDQFSNLEIHHLSSLDHIFVCSNWAKGVVEENIPSFKGKVSVVPLGVDSTIFAPCDQNSSGPTVFFNCGKFEIRKGHDVLVEIFNKAFSDNDDVQLWLMCENPFLDEDEKKKWHNLYHGSKLGSKIRIIPRLSTQKEVYSIMSKIDCGIFPSKAEGWNLELLELMSCGKNVITTNYAAHTEFCNASNALLVDLPEKEPAYDNKWFFGQGNWGKIGEKEIDQFISHMRDIHTLKQNGQLKTNISGIETAKKFNWNNTAETILNNV